MVVMILERVPASLRGELTRWMLEPKTGVFIGRLSGMVRDKLWEKVCQKSGDGGCMMFFNADNEQGFDIRFWGRTSRMVCDWEGLNLVTAPRKSRRSPLTEGGNSDEDADEVNETVEGNSSPLQNARPL